MRFLYMALALCFAASIAIADDTSKDGPTNEKAQKTYKEAFELIHMRRLAPALEEFKKADKQDGGHCLGCQQQMIYYGSKFGEWKTAELGAQEMIAEAQDPKEKAIAHYQLASVLAAEGVETHKDAQLSRAHDELTAALAAFSNFPDAYYLDGRLLAQLIRTKRPKFDLWNSPG
jgi:outer membrane protein assembly factor BamD (BamD/ComL family)